MRTKILLFLLALLPAVSFAQSFPTDPETKKFTFQETVNVDTLSKDLIYERSKEWMGKFYNSTSLDFDNKETGKISKEGTFNVLITYDFKYKTDYVLTYNISIYQKPGKYKYTITDFMIYDSKNGAKTAQSLEAFYAKMRSQNKADFVNKVNAEVNKTIENLKSYMITGQKKNDEDW